MIHLIHQSVTLHGVEIHYVVDYQKMTVSITDQHRNSKNFKFSDRTLEYMTGWKYILEAIGLAIEEGEKLLKARKEENINKTVEGFIAMDEALKASRTNPTPS